MSSSTWSEVTQARVGAAPRVIPLVWGANVPATNFVTGMGPRRIRRATRPADAGSGTRRGRKARARVRREYVRLGLGRLAP